MAALSNARHEDFSREYVCDHNGTQAAIRAGYSAKTAHVQASKLLRNPKIRARIEALEEAALKRVEVSQERVIQLLLDTYESAIKANQHGPAARCVELLGRRHGMFRDVVEDKREKVPTKTLLAELSKSSPELVSLFEKTLGLEASDDG